MSAVPSPLPTGDTGDQRTKIDRFTATELKKKIENNLVEEAQKL